MRKILEGGIVKGNITIWDKKNKEKGSYKIKLDTENKTWCSKVTDKLDNGIYHVKAEVISRNKIKAADTNNFEVYVIPNLYEALLTEFKDDMKEWNASLDKNSLIFSFKDPTALFKKGNSKLNKKFQNILKDFFPRYVKITSEYKEHIQNVVIEGHSSSENRMGKSKIDKFKLNKKLSRNRANNVLSYTNKLVNKHVGKNILWVVDTFESNGLSSSKLIYNKNGTENKEMSRRVEFRIKNIRSAVLPKDI